MTSYQYHYFDKVRAKGELCRLFFAWQNIPVNETKVPFSEWKEAKLRYPMRYLPVLELDGKYFGESQSILRFLGKKHDLYPKDDMDAFEVDVLLSYIFDLHDNWYGHFQAHFLQCFINGTPVNQQLTEEEEAAFNGSVHVQLPVLETMLVKAGGKHFVGKSDTIVEICLYWIIDFITHCHSNYIQLDKKYPCISAMMKRLEEVQSLKKYLSGRENVTF